jgi:hypothetical protein
VCIVKITPVTGIGKAPSSQVPADAKSTPASSPGDARQLKPSVAGNSPGRSGRPGGLTDLASVELLPDSKQLLERAELHTHGDAAWRGRKRAEATDLLRLAQIAPNNRLRVVDIDLTEDLRALIDMRVTVPCRRDNNGQRGELFVARRAFLGLTYPRETMYQSLPGFAFVQIVAPANVWHANVAVEPAQLLCLGDRLPVGVRVKEIMLMSYGALTLTSIQLDPGDAAGVMHPEAARWWQEHTQWIPLSRVPFLGTEDEPEEVGK